MNKIIVIVQSVRLMWSTELVRLSRQLLDDDNRTTKPACVTTVHDQAGLRNVEDAAPYDISSGGNTETRDGICRPLRLSKKPVIASQSADWRGNPFPKRISPALFRRFPAKRLRIPTPVTSVTGSE